MFRYSVQPEDTYDIVATEHYANLTTEESLRRTNSFPATNIPPSATLNVSVNCFCGNESVSKDYGLFVTYPLRPEDSLDAIASSSGVPAETLQRYNPGVDFRSGSGIVFVPGKGKYLSHQIHIIVFYVLWKFLYLYPFSFALDLVTIVN